MVPTQSIWAGFQPLQPPRCRSWDVAPGYDGLRRWRLEFLPQYRQPVCADQAALIEAFTYHPTENRLRKKLGTITAVLYSYRTASNHKLSNAGNGARSFGSNRYRSPTKTAPHTASDDVKSAGLARWHEVASGAGHLVMLLVGQDERHQINVNFWL